MWFIYLRQSLTDPATCVRIADVVGRLNVAQDELAALRPRVGLVSDYERQIRRLRDDIAVLTGRRSALSLPRYTHVPS